MHLLGGTYNTSKPKNSSEKSLAGLDENLNGPPLPPSGQAPLALTSSMYERFVTPPDEHAIIEFSLGPRGSEIKYPVTNIDLKIPRSSGGP